MYKLKTILSSFFLCACFVFAACSSENTPVAEVFLGDWEIFQMNEDNTGLNITTGKMNIDFGDSEIIFELSTGDDDNAVQITGIVYNDNLYTSNARQEKIGSLELTKSNTLLITIEKEEGHVVYHAWK